MEERQGAIVSNEERGVVGTHNHAMPVAVDASHDDFD